MLEKLKSLGEAAKNVLIYILTPIAFVVGFIWYLISKNTSLKTKLKQTEAEKDLAGTLAKKEEASKDANQAETDYNNAVSAYKREHPND